MPDIEAAKRIYNKSLDSYLRQRGVRPGELKAAGTFFEIDAVINVPDNEDRIPSGIKQFFDPFYSPRRVLPYRFRFGPEYIFTYVQPIDTEHPLLSAQFNNVALPDPEDYSDINKGINDRTREERDRWSRYVSQMRLGILIPKEEIVLSAEGFIDLQDTPHISISGTSKADWFRKIHRRGIAVPPLDEIHKRMAGVSAELLLELASIVADKPDVAEQYSKNPANMDSEVFSKSYDFTRQVVLYTKIDDPNETPSVH